VIRSRRPFVAFLLALLVVGVQYGAQLHALGHLSDALKHTQEQSLSTAVANEDCPICALFAGGANALASEDDRRALDVAVAAAPRSSPASIATPAPSYYSSRAPPTLL